VGDAGKPVPPNLSGSRSFGEIVALLCVLLNEDAQGAVLGSAEELEVDDIETVRSGDALRRRANLIHIKCHLGVA
jgi:hypothetical protein